MKGEVETCLERCNATLPESSWDDSEEQSRYSVNTSARYVGRSLGNPLYCKAARRKLSPTPSCECFGMVLLLDMDDYFCQAVLDTFQLTKLELSLYFAENPIYKRGVVSMMDFLRVLPTTNLVCLLGEPTPSSLASLRSLRS